MSPLYGLRVGGDAGSWPYLDARGSLSSSVSFFSMLLSRSPRNPLLCICWWSHRRSGIRTLIMVGE
jgi:hypothetical protein